MINLFLRWVLLSLSLMLVAWVVPGVKITGFTDALAATAVIGFVNIFIRPLALFLFFPINILTLGLFTFIINALLLLLVANIVPGFEIHGFLYAIAGSILLSFFSVIINWAAGELQPA